MQALIRAHPAKRHVICAGRRSGKTTLASMVAVERALAGGRVLLASATQEQADVFWELCRRWLAGPIDAGLIYKNESLRLMRFPGGGRIRAKTARDADALRSDYADFLVLDEFALMDRSAWYEVGAPMLIDNGGTAWLISTPKHRNHFYNLYTEALNDKTGQWKAWHFTSYDNPYLDRAALEAAARDMPESAYRQEILAEFVLYEGLIYDEFREDIHVLERDVTEFTRFYAGVDEGYTNPMVCLVCGEDGDGRLHVIEEFYRRRVLQDDFVRICQDLCAKYPGLTFFVDSSAAGLIAAMRRAGLPVRSGSGLVYDGIQAVKARLRICGDGRPRLTVSPACRSTILEFASYIWDQGRGSVDKDMPRKENDHAMDALRYVCMNTAVRKQVLIAGI